VGVTLRGLIVLSFAREDQKGKGEGSATVGESCVEVLQAASTFKEDDRVLSVWKKGSTVLKEALGSIWHRPKRGK